MIGAGIVFVMFGVASLCIGKELSGGGSDILALIELPFYIAGTVMTAGGLGLILIGSTT